MPKKREVGIVNVTFGKNVTIIEPSNVYHCKLQDNVFVGPFVEIQSDVIIGARTKIQSHSFICSKVTIGDDCFIGHGVMFVNDLFRSGGPAKGNTDLWGSTAIGSRVSIGSNATILAVTICNDVVIGAGSVVTKNIDESGVYFGNPAKKHHDSKIIP